MKKIILIVLLTLMLQAERCEMSFAMSGVYVYETKEGMVVDPEKYKEVTHKVSRECEVKAKLAVFELWSREQEDDGKRKIFLIKTDGSVINIANRILSTPTNIPPKENKMYMPMCTAKGEDIVLAPGISLHTRCAYRYNDTLAYDTAGGIIVNFDTRYSEVRMLQEMSDNQCCSINMKNAIQRAKKEWYKTDHTRYLVKQSSVDAVQQLAGHRTATKEWLRSAMIDAIEYDAVDSASTNKEINDFSVSKVTVDKPVISVELFKTPIYFGDKVNDMFDYIQLNIHITSLVNKIAIKKLVVNRGNCIIDNTYYSRVNDSLQISKVLPRKLLYGEKVKVHIMKGCTVKEAKVVTDKGTFTYNWK